MNKIILFVVISLGVLLSCSDTKSKARDENNIQFDEEQINALDDKNQSLKSKIAQLSFIIEGKKYEMAEKTEEVNIIPFAMYKPIDEEEGQTNDESLVWMKGKNSENPAQTITAEFTIEGKLTKGNFICKNGRLEAYPDYKYLDIIEMNLEVIEVQDKTFMPELKGYSVKIKFSGKVKEAGAKGRELNVEQGNINIKY